MADFRIVDVPGTLSVSVTTVDTGGRAVPDPDWHREAAESQYVFAEFLQSQGLLVNGIDVSRRPDLIILWSELTDTGKAFAKSDYDKWLRSIDTSGTPESVKREKLAKRWRKFGATTGEG
jgi:hypothetical protein